jgi:polysaccharide biosynthesis protein PslH
MAHLISGMAARHDVALLCFRTAEEAPVDAETRQRCALVEEVPRQIDRGPFVQRALRGVRLLAAPLGGTPIWAEAFRSRTLARRLRQQVTEWRPELVQADFHVMGQYLDVSQLAPAGGRMATVLVEHEPGVPAAVERLGAAPSYARAWHLLDVAAWRRFERRVLRAAEAVVAFTERDRRALQVLAPEARIETIPIAVPLPSQPYGARASNGSEILFVGNFEHPPNREAAARLIGTILPAVRTRHPAARLTLVGHYPDGGPPAGVREGVTVTGRVPDVAPYLEAAAVVAAPLFTGGGMRLKVLEALGAGRAVVASPLAVEGLDITDGEHVLLARDDHQFAECIAALLDDPHLRTELAHRARLWAERHVSIPRMLADYDTLYEGILARYERIPAGTRTANP